MNGSAYINLTLLVTLLLAAALTIAEARGGRRGGGSLGGIFGGWRKYKKPSSGGGGGHGRRNINGSPMQTTAIKANGSPSSAQSASSSLKAQTQSRTQANYPRQPMNAANAPPSYGSYYGGAGGTGAAYMPPGSTYYANTAAMPPGAIYYAQPPMQSTSGSGDFLFGLMAGHMLFGHRPHVTHVYHQRQQPAASSSDGKTIIIDNSGGTATVHQLRPGDSDSNSSTDTAPRYWPTETKVPLAPFNATVTPAEAIKPDTSTNINSVSDSDIASAQQVPAPPPGGIICVPVLFNETDPSDPSKTHNVERVICFPAPPPPPPPALSPMPPAATASSTAPQCALRTFVESDPNDPTKTIEVQKEYCSTAATTKQVQVAGEIGENNNAATEANKQPTTTVTATLTSTSATASTPATPTTTGLLSTSDKPSEALTAS